jgi:hypothetical protein
METVYSMERGFPKNIGEKMEMVEFVYAPRSGFLLVHNETS